MVRTQRVKEKAETSLRDELRVKHCIFDELYEFKGLLVMVDKAQRNYKKGVNHPLVAAIERILEEVTHKAEPLERKLLKLFRKMRRHLKSLEVELDKKKSGESDRIRGLLSEAETSSSNLAILASTKGTIEKSLVKAKKDPVELKTTLKLVSTAFASFKGFGKIINRLLSVDAFIIKQEEHIEAMVKAATQTANFEDSSEITGKLVSLVKKNRIKGFSFRGRKMIITGPRELPTPEELIRKNNVRIAVSDISFDLTCMKKSAIKRDINTLQYIDALESHGGRLILWVDHHDFSEVLPLWDRVKGDSRFRLVPRSSAPACPQLITSPIPADIYLTHSDFDGLMSGIKMLFGNESKSVYREIDKDAIVADARPKGTSFSKTGELIYGAIKGGQDVFKNDEVGYTILRWLTDCITLSKKLEKGKYYEVVFESARLYNAMKSNSDSISRLAKDYGGVIAIDATGFASLGFDANAVGKDLAKRSVKGVAIVRFADKGSVKYSFYIDTYRTQLEAKSIFGSFVPQFVPFKFSMTPNLMIEHKIPLNVAELAIFTTGKI
jgi:hypothetical protein